MYQKLLIINRLILLVIITILVGCGQKDHEQILTITSTPQSAAVWLDNELLGATPLKIKISKTRFCELRISSKGYHNHIQKTPTKRKNLEVKLKPVIPYMISCKADPHHCQLFIRGEMVGQTPCTIYHTLSENIAVSFKCERFEEQLISLALTPSKRNYSLNITLDSTVALNHLEKIEENPDDIHSYVDLCHEYITQKRFKDAIDILKKALLLVGNNSAISSKRLDSEVQRICSEQYEIGSESEMKQLRKMVYEMFASIIEKNDSVAVKLLSKFTIVARYTGNSDKIYEYVKSMYEKYPDNKKVIKEYQVWKKFNNKTKRP